MDLTRRQVLGAGGAAAGVAIAGGTAARGGSDPAPARGLPAPADSGLDHIVVVMMENRSFDHYLGWLPGADGRQAGPDVQGRRRQGAPDAPPHRLPRLRLPGPRPQLQRRPRAAQRRRVRRRFRKGRNDELAIGYYIEQKTWRSTGRWRRNWTTSATATSLAPGPDLPEPLLLALRARRTGSVNNFDRSPTCRRSGTGSTRPG